MLDLVIGLALWRVVGAVLAHSTPWHNQVIKVIWSLQFPSKPVDLKPSLVLNSVPGIIFPSIEINLIRPALDFSRI